MITVTDLFAGAGGSSTGAIAVPGVSIRAASNHWQLACDVHNSNHPQADHICADISQISPRYFPRTDILWASPECTNHSQAKGRKRTNSTPDLFGETLPSEAAERSRATMWDVPRFAEVHHYDAVIVENVVDAMHWLPFRAWLLSMTALGYANQLVFLNSMHAQAAGLPAPQSRDRMYVVFSKKGNRRPDLDAVQRPKAWCDRCDRVVDAMQVFKQHDRPYGKYRSQYTYRCPNLSCRYQVVEPGWLPAYAAIDWTLDGQRIGNRAKPLAEKTMRRIQAGIDRYWSPIHLEAAGHTYDAADPKHKNFGQPGAYYRAWPVDEPIKTLHTIESKAVAFMTEHRFEYRTRSLDDPAPTVTASGNALGIVEAPFIAELRGGGSTARSTEEPLSTVTASGNHHALLMPYYSSSGSKPFPTAQPHGTMTTLDRYALIIRNNTGGAEMTTPVDEPLRTVTTHGHQSVMQGRTVNIDDVHFRMLEPHEIAAAMAFPGDYQWQGTRRERVRMAGNAVTPPAARDLIGAVTETLAAVA